jgi:hypothetical protein
MRRKRKTSIIKVVYLILLLQLIGLILIYHFFYKNDIIKILPEGFVVSNKKLNPNNKGETLFFNDDFTLIKSFENKHHLKRKPLELILDIVSILSFSSSIDLSPILNTETYLEPIQIQDNYLIKNSIETIADTNDNWELYTKDSDPLWNYMGDIQSLFNLDGMYLETVNTELFEELNKEITDYKIISNLENILNHKYGLIDELGNYTTNNPNPTNKALLDNKQIITIKTWLQIKKINQKNEKMKKLINNKCSVYRILINYDININTFSNYLDQLSLEASLLNTLKDSISKFEGQTLNPKGLFLEITFAYSKENLIPFTILYIGEPFKDMRYDSNGISKVNLIETVDSNNIITTPIELPIVLISQKGSVLPQQPTYSIVYDNSDKKGGKLEPVVFSPLNKIYNLPEIYAQVHIPFNNIVNNIKIYTNEENLVTVYEAKIHNNSLEEKGNGKTNSIISLKKEIKGTKQNYLLIKIDNINHSTIFYGGKINIKKKLNIF